MHLAGLLSLSGYNFISHEAILGSIHHLWGCHKGLGADETSLGHFSSQNLDPTATR